jgi:hypothetical protein
MSNEIHTATSRNLNKGGQWRGQHFCIHISRYGTFCRVGPAIDKDVHKLDHSLTCRGASRGLDIVIQLLDARVSFGSPGKKPANMCESRSKPLQAKGTNWSITCMLSSLCGWLAELLGMIISFREMYFCFFT